MKTKTFYKFGVIFLVCLLYLSENSNAEITAICLNGRELKTDPFNIRYICPKCYKHFDLKNKKNFVEHIINECLQPNDEVRIYKNQKLCLIFILVPINHKPFFPFKKIAILDSQVIHYKCTPSLEKLSKQKRKNVLKTLEEIFYKVHPLSRHKIMNPGNYVILTRLEIITQYENAIVIQFNLIRQIVTEILAFLFLNNPVIKHPIASQAIKSYTIEELEEIAKVLRNLLEE